MEYSERLQHVTVLGAAGKMGSGILLLTAIEMADLSLQPENKNKQFILQAIDTSDEGLAGLIKYLRNQVLKAAEKKAVALRAVYADRLDLIDNEEIIQEYVNHVVGLVRPSTRMESAYQSRLIFEAIKEDPALKVSIFKQINQNNPHQPWFFTNTSSIPISKLDADAELGGRVLGVHFYNPPAIQKLVEIIRAEKTQDALVEFANTYSKNLKKIVVPSHDFAGFIGNGHFMRDALYGIQQAQNLQNKYSFAESVYIINKISQDFLIRPMGIFQLIDYVGIDVCQYIMSVMNPYLKNEDLHSELLDTLLANEIRGGQRSDGSQKDGFLKYEKGKITAIFDLKEKKYIGIENIQSQCDADLGSLPASWKPWKAVVGNKQKEEIFTAYFNELKLMDSMGATMAKSYALRSKEIGLNLVKDGVAHNEEDVNTVLLTGFFHAYGPIQHYLG